MTSAPTLNPSATLSTAPSSALCPCRVLETGSASPSPYHSYAVCCGPIHSDASRATTAEALMRARYSAYVKGNIDFIQATNDPESKEAFDRAAAEKWSRSAEWLGLEIRAVEAGNASDSIGRVEFLARFNTDGDEFTHHEIGSFRRTPRGWLFIEGQMVQAPLVRSAPKIGRNDPCSCGSGKKYKKCCGIAAVSAGV